MPCQTRKVFCQVMIVTGTDQLLSLLASYNRLLSSWSSTRCASGRQREKWIPRYGEYFKGDNEWCWFNGHTQVSFMFPEYACIHGIAYNPWGFLIYGFFPRALRISADGTPCEWGFGCTVVSIKFANVFKNYACFARMDLVKYLLFVHRHATHLSHVLRNLTLSDEFVKCDQLLMDRNGSLGTLAGIACD